MATRLIRIVWVLLIVVTVGVMGSNGSCVVTTEDPNLTEDMGADEAQDDDMSRLPPVPVLVVRFVNETPYAVEVEFFTTESEPDLADLEGSLFNSDNAVINGIGFAGLGVLEADGVDEITLSCDTAAMGTLGGRFLDADGGELGTGQQRFLIKDSQYRCKDVITIFYKLEEDAFDTSLLVQ